MTTGGMVSVAEALSIIVEGAGRVGSEIAPLGDSPGRVLAEDQFSDIDIPPFDKAAVDGYAVDSRDLETLPARLGVTSVISAGEMGWNRVERGVCVKIMTGAPLPGGADAVVMVEDTEPLDGQRAVLVKRALSPGANVCYRGEDTKRGQKVLSAGCAIGAPEVAVLASIGMCEVGVARRPQVGVLSTGNEIVEPGTPLAPGMIRNSNGAMLSALARSAGGNVEYLGIAGDDVERLRRSLGKGLGKDILLVSGGVSMGDYDLVPRVLGELGVEVLFHKVRVKPGKPLLFGRRGRCLVFGIPGNPVSSFVVFHLFVKPAFGRMTAYSGAAGVDDAAGAVRPPYPATVSAVLGQDFSYRSDRTYVVPARRSFESGRLVARPLKLNGSADIVSCAGCDCLLVFEGGSAALKEGSPVSALLLGG